VIVETPVIVEAALVSQELAVEEEEPVEIVVNGHSQKAAIRASPMKASQPAEEVEEAPENPEHESSNAAGD